MSNPDHPTIVFDFDGTLADTLDLSFSIINQLAVEYRFRPLCYSQLDDLKKMHAREILHLLQIPWYKLPFVLMAAKRRQTSELLKLSVSIELTELLQELAQHCRLGILTSNSQHNVQKFLLKNKITCFDFIQGNASLLNKSKSLRRLLKTQGLHPQRTIYIGDEVRDIEAARACNMAAIAVSWGYNHSHTLAAAQPDAVVQTLQQLRTSLHNFLRAAVAPSNTALLQEMSER